MLTATTSHKREPLLPTLELFGVLGLRDIDLNLHHILETGVPVNGGRRCHRRAWACGCIGVRRLVRFLPSPPEIEDTFASVSRQVAIGTELGVSTLRLFFGRLRREDYSRAKADIVCAQSLPAVRCPSGLRLRVREPRRRVARSRRLPRDPGPRGAAEHPDEFRSHQLRQSRRRSGCGARRRSPRSSVTST